MGHTRKPTLLLVDNDDEYLRSLSIALESRGYTCVRASTGAQGFLALETHDIDLVITDLNMPGGDGALLTERIRRQSIVPIIVATGFRDEFREQLGGIPLIHVIRKPFDVEDLLTIVESSLATDQPT